VIHVLSISQSEDLPAIDFFVTYFPSPNGRPQTQAHPQIAPKNPHRVFNVKNPSEEMRRGEAGVSEVYGDGEEV
jgi:hypothetical protein